MRALLITFILSAASVCQAANPATKQPVTPARFVFEYECRHVNPAQTGFQCGWDPKTQIVLFTRIDDASQPQEQRDLHAYELDKMLIRLYQLGGDHFELRNTAWKESDTEWCDFDRKKILNHETGEQFDDPTQSNSGFSFGCDKLRNIVH